MSRLVTLLLGLALGLLTGFVATGAAAQTADLHDLDWYVHTDLIDAGAGRDLAFWQGVIDQASADGNAILEGGQGPADTPCCTRLTRSAAVQTFGSAGDGLDVLDSAGEYSTIAATGGSGSRAFLVDSLTYCGGSAPGAVGCAQIPPCTGNPNDDPTLYLVVTVDALDSNILGRVLAHERGHNACLNHVETDECLLMRGGGGGGCLLPGECTNFRAGRTTTGGTCDCHDLGGGVLPDYTSCSEVAGGICSGGVCGAATGDAALQLFCAAGPESANGEATDEAIRISALTGDWTSLGPFTTTSDEVQGLAFATDSGVLYGVIPSAGDDFLVVIDRVSGDATTVGTIPNGSREFVALAYDPGATSAIGDDRLLALETDGSFEQLHEILPSQPNTSTNLGGLAFGAPDGFRGLAFDSASGRLFAASPFADGIYEVSFTCNPFCGLTQQVGLDVPRFDAALAYSPLTGQLYLTGTQSPVSPLGRRLLYDVIDPATLAKQETGTLDSLTPAGLAALPPPPACSDGADNDGDGFVDFPADPGCASATSTIENPQCQDGIDNDGQPGTDFDGGVSVLGAGNGDPNGADPQCTSPTRNKEQLMGGGSCGVGPELVGLLPLLWFATRRRSQR